MKTGWKNSTFIIVCEKTNSVWHIYLGNKVPYSLVEFQQKKFSIQIHLLRIYLNEKKNIKILEFKKKKYLSELHNQHVIDKQRNFTVSCSFATNWAVLHIYINWGNIGWSVIQTNSTTILIKFLYSSIRQNI